MPSDKTPDRRDELYDLGLVLVQEGVNMILIDFVCALSLSEDDKGKKEEAKDGIKTDPTRPRLRRVDTADTLFDIKQQAIPRPIMESLVCCSTATRRCAKATSSAYSGVCWSGLVRGLFVTHGRRNESIARSQLVKQWPRSGGWTLTTSGPLPRWLGARPDPSLNVAAVAWPSRPALRWLEARDSITLTTSRRASSSSV